MSPKGNTMKKLKFSAAATVVLGGMAAILPTGIAVAAGFDCSKAAAPVEKLICSDPDLSKADGDMAAAYRDAINAAQPQEAARIRLEQKAWFAHRGVDCHVSVADLEAVSIRRDKILCNFDMTTARTAALTSQKVGGVPSSTDGGNKAEETRRTDEARKAEEARRDEYSRRAEEYRRADDARKAEDARKTIAELPDGLKTIVSASVSCSVALLRVPDSLVNSSQKNDLYKLSQIVIISVAKIAAAQPTEGVRKLVGDEFAKSINEAERFVASLSGSQKSDYFNKFVPVCLENVLPAATKIVSGG